METKLRKILTDNGMIETEKHNKAIHEICIIIQRFNELKINHFLFGCSENYTYICNVI
jgi:hypothetical protein